MSLIGDSSSSSTTNNSSWEKNDASILQAGTLAIRGDGNTVLDGGAIEKVFAYATQLNDANIKTWEELTGSLNTQNSGVINTVQTALNDVRASSKAAADATAKAYETASGSINTTTVMIIGAVLLAAGLYFMRGRK